VELFILTKEYIFLFKALFFGLAAVVIIPKKELRKFFVYGLIFGGAGDLLLILVMGTLLHQLKYLNMGVFNIFGIFPFWTPLAWTFTLMFFLYCLPLRKIIYYPYIICFGMFGYMVGILLQNFNLYEYIGIYKFFAPAILTGYLTFCAWAYRRLEGLELKTP
jgi:hypothetical protein